MVSGREEFFCAVRLFVGSRCEDDCKGLGKALAAGVVACWRGTYGLGGAAAGCLAAKPIVVGDPRVPRVPEAVVEQWRFWE